MKVNSQTTKELSNTLKPFPFSLDESSTLRDGIASSSRAGIRRRHKETALVKTFQSKEDAYLQFQSLEWDLIEAMDEENYPKALSLTDKLIKLSKDYNLAVGYSCLSTKAYLLQKLGRLEEAYSCLGESLLGLTLPGKDWEEELKKTFIESRLKQFQENRSQFPDHSTISYEKHLDDLYECLRPFFQQSYEVTKQERRGTLIIRGIIALKLKKKELAIQDFKEAITITAIYEYPSHDREFLLRCLEKELNEPFMPTKDREQIVKELSQKADLSSDEQYELMISYAFLGEEKKALELYNKIDEKNEIELPEETAFLLAWLRNDLETAKCELAKCERKDMFDIFMSRSLT